MDMESGKQQLITAIKKYQCILWVVLVGVFLMLLPQNTEESEVPSSQEVSSQQDLESELAVILSRIAGVGDAQVLLTEASGSNTIYQMDAGQNQGNLDTVVVMDGNRQETGLVKQILPPAYRGAIVVCQGAASANVRLSVINAVKSVTGLSSDCITVLEMK